MNLHQTIKTEPIEVKKQVNIKQLFQMFLVFIRFDIFFEKLNHYLNLSLS